METQRTNKRYFTANANIVSLIAFEVAIVEFKLRAAGCAIDNFWVFGLSCRVSILNNFHSAPEWIRTTKQAVLSGPDMPILYEGVTGAWAFTTTTTPLFIDADFLLSSRL